MTNSAISQLSKNIAVSNATDRQQQRRLYEQLVIASANSRGAARPEFEFLLETATDIARYLAEGHQPSLEALLTMMTRLVVNAECSLYRDLEAPARQARAEPAPATAPKPPARDLELAPRPKELAEPQDLNRMRLGQMLVHLGLAQSEHVQAALEVQRAEGIRLGEALARLGHLNPHDLREALGLQTKMRKYAYDNSAGEPPEIEFPEWKESMLGEVLLSSGAVSEEQLRSALVAQRATGMRIGEVLVQEGICDWGTVRAAIRLQEKLRHGERRPSLKLSPGGIFDSDNL
jgi:hypothetical protein